MGTTYTIEQVRGVATISYLVQWWSLYSAGSVVPFAVIGQYFIQQYGGNPSNSAF